MKWECNKCKCKRYRKSSFNSILDGITKTIRKCVHCGRKELVVDCAV